MTHMTLFLRDENGNALVELFQHVGLYLFLLNRYPQGWNFKVIWIGVEKYGVT